MTQDNAGVKTSYSGVLQSVQVLRGLAALMVVLCHVLGNLTPAAAAGESDSILNFGVDVFFVISGFIMVSSTSGRQMDMKQFMWARISRIVPLYWLALLATAGLLALTGGRVPGVWEVVQAAFFIPYQDPQSGAYLPFLPVGWTLNYEMVFYLAFAATIAIGGLRQLMLISLLFALFVAGRLVLNPESAIGFRLTSPLFFEFTMGMVVALILPRLRALPAIGGLALLAAGVVAILVLHPLHTDFGLARAVAHGGPAALVVAGALALEPWFRRTIFAPLRALGDASYSLYLTHILPLMVVPQLLPVAMPYWIKLVVLTGVCVIVGGLCYRLVEQPLNRTFRGRKRAKTGATVLA